MSWRKASGLPKNSAAPVARWITPQRGSRIPTGVPADSNAGSARPKCTRGPARMNCLAGKPSRRDRLSLEERRDRDTCHINTRAAADVTGARSTPQLHGKPAFELTKGALRKPAYHPTLDSENKKGTMFLICSWIGRRTMLRMFVEEAAALASITLFVGMVAVWAQLIPQL
jgi:hypothetical protein